MKTAMDNLDLPYLAAAVQFNPEWGEPERNRTRMAKLLAEAAEKGAKLIVFPEMASSGYVWDSREEIAPYVETVPGPTTDALHFITKEYNCFTVVGLPEIDSRTNIYYNSAVLIGPEGVVGTYRKTHLFAADPRWAREGSESIPVFETSIGRVAVLICMDAMYFEPARIAALQDADIIAFPTNWVGASNNPPSKTWCLRAKENSMYWVAANRSDQERGAIFTGGSAVIGPTGEAIESLVSGEGIVYGEIRLSADKRRSILQSRRPQAYQDLLLHPYLWREGETRAISSPAAYTIALVPLNREDIGDMDKISKALLNMVKREHSSQFRLFILHEIEFSLPEVLSHMQAILVKYDVNIVVSLVETGKEHSVYFISPDGVKGKASLVHTTTAVDQTELFRTIDLPFGRIGLLTEQDACFPESFRVLAKQGADIVCVSGSGMASDGLAWMRRIWAFENDLVIAVSLQNGMESMLSLHKQIHLEGDSGKEGHSHDFLPEQLETARSRPFMRRLKTHLYDKLIEINN